jgi:hypothetical protein
VQGAKKVQGRSVFRHTLEFELFVATQQLGDFQQPVIFALILVISGREKIKKQARET